MKQIIFAAQCKGFWIECVYTLSGNVFIIPELTDKKFSTIDKARAYIQDNRRETK